MEKTMKRNITILALALVMAITSILIAQGQQEGSVQPVSEKNSRKVPARLIPVPNTVSPELQAVIAHLRTVNFSIPLGFGNYR